VGGQGNDVLTPLGGVSEHAARCDAWFATPLGNAMETAEARAVVAMTDPRPGEHPLDAGCGTGRYTRRMAAHGAIVTGVDSDPEMLAAAQLKTPAATFIQTDITALPFAAASGWRRRRRDPFTVAHLQVITLAELGRARPTP
jgi:SAM-dependent methyltransferase